MNSAEVHFEALVDAYADTLGVTTGKLFGHPCLKVEGKAYSVLFVGAVVFKLGREEVARLQERHPSVHHPDPSGKNRPMRDWMEAPAELARHCPSWAEQSRDLVMSLA